jgi:two-component system, cell cycle sensor histidine kinase and response regulator CckA
MTRFRRVLGFDEHGIGCYGFAMTTTVSQPRSSLADRKTILLVDDDKATLQVLRKMLQQQGYAVLFASDGELALKLFRLHDRPIHLLLTDVVMPHVSGPQLAERVRALRPAMPVLFISGLMQEAAVKEWLRTGVRFLRKPVAQEQLMENVQELTAILS